jgi:hypothetical protein
MPLKVPHNVNELTKADLEFIAGLFAHKRIPMGYVNLQWLYIFFLEFMDEIHWEPTSPNPPYYDEWDLIDTSLERNEAFIDFAKQVGFEAVAAEIVARHSPAGRAEAKAEEEAGRMLEELDVTIPSVDDPNFLAKVEDIIRGLALRVVELERTSGKVKVRKAGKEYLWTSKDVMKHNEEIVSQLAEAKFQLEKTRKEKEQLEKEKVERETVKFKVKFKVDMPPWYKKDQVVSATDVEWVRNLVSRGIVDLVEGYLPEPTHKVAPPPTPTPTPPPPKPMQPIKSAEAEKLAAQRAETRFFALLAEKGVTVDAAKRRGYYAMFQDKYVGWKEEGKSTDEILGDLIPSLISEIQGLEETRAVIRQRERTVRVGVPREKEEEKATAVPRVPKASLSSLPLSSAPWPRGPTSEEQIMLWNAFQYRLQEKGYNASDFADEYREYIEKSQFESWFDLLAKFEEFVKSVMAGEEHPLPSLEQWRGFPLEVSLEGTFRKIPTERLEDAIVHFSQMIIRNGRYYGKPITLEKLWKELDERGLIDPSVTLDLPTIKNALEKARVRNDVWLTNISQEEINNLLSTHLPTREEMRQKAMRPEEEKEE